MRIIQRILTAVRPVAALISGLLLLPVSHGADKTYPGPFFEDEQLLIALRPHAPEQMAAFYEARGFPQRAIDIITAGCFVTVSIKNKSRQVTWLETANWKLRSGERVLDIMGRDYWDKKWDEIDLPQANRSTFYWTQLPAVVDLQADEPVGGNIVVPGDVDTFDIVANFNTGQDKQGKKIQVRFDHVECPREVPAP